LLQNKIVKDVAIKTIITGGKSSNGLKIDGEPTVLITLADLKAVSPENKLYEEGARVISVEFQRFSPMVKTTNYIFALQNQEKKELAEANEIIYHNRGLLLEGSTSNVFIVKDKKIITPAINILVGVTRNFVIKVLEKSEIEIEEREVKFEELLNADEVFLTGSFKNILPIIQVDDIIIGDRAVGRITKQLMKMFEENLK
jgi:branched-subunit amino acid aminotransferase/4-amino-4-deoxychorismate lyase